MDANESDSSDSDSDSGSEDDQSVTEEEQLRIAAAAVEERDQQLTSLLARKDELPLRTRNRLNELVFELLTKMKKDVHEMICHNNSRDDDDRGLDSSRDTEAQVETALRFFPEVISQPCWEDGDEDEGEGEGEEYPIQRLCNNRKAVSFIAGVARLAIEYHSFEDHERGGLLLEDFHNDNTFRNIMYHFTVSRPPIIVIVTLLKRLRRMGLSKKDDIKEYRLVFLLCACPVTVPEKVFQFLVEWDPTSLVHTDGDGVFPLHYACGTIFNPGRISCSLGVRNSVLSFPKR